MIEIEKKFLLSAEEETRLLAGAKEIGMKEFTDQYYDTVDFLLTKKDWWLRQRDNIFELKLAQQPGAPGFDQREEIEEEKMIREKLGIEETGQLENILPEKGYSVFCHCVTKRKIYERDGATIVVDAVIYPDEPAFTYRLAEIEMLAADEAGAEAARVQIKTLAEECGLSLQIIRGKVREYLKQFRSAQYEVLLATDAARGNVIG